MRYSEILIEDLDHRIEALQNLIADPSATEGEKNAAKRALIRLLRKKNRSKVIPEPNPVRGQTIDIMA